MNRRLLRELFPFQYNELPEYIEFYLEQHRGGRCVALSHGHGNVLAVGLADGSIALYDLLTRSRAKTLRGHTADVYSLTFIRGTSLLVSTSLDFSLRLWDIRGPARRGTECVVCVKFEGAVARACVDAHHFARTRACCVSQLNQEAILLRVPEAPGEYHVSAPECDARRLTTTAAAAAPFASLRETCEHCVTPVPPSLSATSSVPINYIYAAFHPSGRYVVSYSASRPGTIDVFDVGRWRRERQRRGAAGAISSTPASHLVSSTFVHAKAFVKYLDFAASGDQLLSVSHDRIVRVFAFHPASVFGAGDGSDERTAASSSSSSSSSLSSSSSSSLSNGTGENGGALVAQGEFRDLILPVHWRCAQFTANGDYLIAASASSSEHRMYIWDLASAQLFKQMDGPREAIGTMLWHPHMNAIVTLGMPSGTVYVYHRRFQENWSAFAPGFKELDENEEYVEAEDEFDIVDDTTVYDRRKKRGMNDAEEDAVSVDITGHDGGDAEDVDGADGADLTCLPVETGRGLDSGGGGGDDAAAAEAAIAADGCARAAKATPGSASGGAHRGRRGGATALESVAMTTANKPKTGNFASAMLATPPPNAVCADADGNGDNGDVADRSLPSTRRADGDDGNGCEMS